MPEQLSTLPGSAFLSPGLLRMALASIVVISHFTKASFGIAAVNLFFVLSGYWIYRMYENKYMKARRPVFLFLASRFMRVLPIFWLFNGLAIGMHYAMHDKVLFAQKPVDIFSNVFVLGYASLPQMALVPAWSLDIELQFYLIFPLLYLALKAARAYASTLVAAALVISAICACALRDSAYIVFPFLGFFMLGGLAADRKWLPSSTAMLAGWVVSIFVLASVLLIPTLRGFAIHDIDAGKFSWNSALNFALTLFLAPIFLFSVHMKSTRADRLLGDMSYVLYCSHWLAVLAAANYLADLPHLTKAPIVVALLLVIYLMSFFLTIYVDRPIGRWRERWVMRNLEDGDAAGRTGSAEVKVGG
jgi:peptidoglycan/LPS O-acetylase OafA/YrhL